VIEFNAIYAHICLTLQGICFLWHIPCITLQTM